MIRTAPPLAAWLALLGAAALGLSASSVLAQNAFAPAANAQPAVAQAPAPSSLSEIKSIQLRKDEGELNLAFGLTRPVPIEVVGNLPRRVLVLKFSNTRLAFPDGKSQFLYNDPMVIGVAFEAIDDTTIWAKIRLRTPDLIYQLKQDTANNRVLLGLKPSPTPIGIELTALRMTAPQREASQAALDFTRVPQMEDKVQGSSYVVRLKNVTPRVRGELKGEDERIALQSVERDGTDTLVKFQLKRPVRVSSLALANPPRLVFNFRSTGDDVTQARPGTPTTPAPVGESLEALIAAEPDAVVRANYTAGERAFEAGNYARAEQLFSNVYAAAPRRRLGIRAGLRASDARFEVMRAEGATNWHGLIAQYQSVIRAAEEAKYNSDQIPHAFFQIGRSYQQMGFNFESNTYFSILQERFPNDPSAANAFYYTGENQLTLRKYPEAIDAFRKFLERKGDPALEGPAHYWVGDALYNLKDNVGAKYEFDQGRRLDPDFPAQNPLLLFHMGEAYYENADFETARLAYRQLLEKYPDKAYSKLVGLRLGDFLRDEGKEAEALQVYQQVIQNAPPAIELRGKMRIANIYSARPVGDDWKQSISLYDEVLASPAAGGIGPEAQLRKALTLTLHNQNRDAITSFEALAKTYPDSSLVRDNIVKANIEENLRSEIDRMFQKRDYWEIVKFYTQYRDQYFRKFPFPVTLFQVARAYQSLGLYDQAIGMYEDLQKGNPGTLRTLVDWQRAQALADKDDMGGAEAALLQFINEHKNDQYSTDVRLKLGQVYGESRRYQDAQTAYRILLQDYEKNKTPELIEAAPEIYFRLGMLEKDLGQNNDALEHFKQAVATFNHALQGDDVPDYIVRAQFYAADLMFDLGQNQEAINAYEQAISRYPNHERAPWARYQIGLIYRRTGQDQKALDSFNQLLELAKTRPGELWESLAQENQRDLTTKLQYQKYLKQ